MTELTEAELDRILRSVKLPEYRDLALRGAFREFGPTPGFIEILRESIADEIEYSQQTPATVLDAIIAEQVRAAEDITRDLLNLP
jgi:hypothetical protein